LPSKSAARKEESKWSAATARKDLKKRGTPGGTWRLLEEAEGMGGSIGGEVRRKG